MRIELNRIVKIDYLIRHKATGSPVYLATQLGISKRTLFETLSFMKNSLHAPIVYNKYRQTYIYQEEGFFCFDFQKEQLSKKQNLKNSSITN